VAVPTDDHKMHEMHENNGYETQGADVAAFKLYDLDFEALQGYAAAQGWPAYRAEQIFSWCAKGAPIDEMHNLGRDIREELKGLGLGGVEIAQRHKSADGSEKYLFRLGDGNAVEGVLMQYRHGGSLCISTQAGCAMGCVFCASGEGGLARNLTAGEMAGQLYAVARLYPNRPFNHVVLMGCGEPLDNLDAVLRFLSIVTHEKGMNLSMRNISLSTCGLVPEMDALARHKLALTLCVSLHASDDDTRRALMPIARRYAIDEVIDAARRYERATGRRVIFEYILIKGVNDSPQAAKRLIARTRGMRSHINLIALNEGAAGGMSPPDEAAMRHFLKVLTDGGASATLRRRLGADVAGACGQLRARRKP
jgi:23S rRNA (adenine2503-C2)-methyltransferase